MSVVCKNVRCRRGERLVFEDVSLTVAPSQMVVLRGPNGAGKSSLLRLIAGFLPPAGGTIFRPPFHYVPPPTVLAEALTVEETLDYWGGILGGDAGDNHDAVLKQFGLTQRRNASIGSLSTGQKRRVVLARLLIAKKPLWLLDEPFASLDKEGEAALYAALEAHCSKGGMVFLAGHKNIKNAKQLWLPEGRWK